MIPAISNRDLREAFDGEVVHLWSALHERRKSARRLERLGCTRLAQGDRAAAASIAHELRALCAVRRRARQLATW